jgi:hypothetical protein
MKQDDVLKPLLYMPYRYQNFFRISVWLIFLITYSQAGERSVCISLVGIFTWHLVRQPTERLDPNNNWTFDEWEIVLYVLALSFFIEGSSSDPLIPSLCSITFNSPDTNRVSCYICHQITHFNTLFPSTSFTNSSSS